jgi:protein SCO1/2
MTYREQTIKLLVVFIGFAILMSADGTWAQQHPATGIVLQVGKTHSSIVVSCDAIEGYMGPMDMSFSVQDPKSLISISPGMLIRFTISKRDNELYADSVQPVPAGNFEPEGMEVGGLETLRSGLNPTNSARAVSQGEPIPDFELTDQAGKKIRLSNFVGKVVLLTFGYSRCPNPDYCFRLSNNLAGVERRFSSRVPRDLVLVTIAIDPEHDNGKILAEYAAVWKADPAKWHFLTGPLSEVKDVAAMFGMNFWREEGLLTHSLHTVVIDRSGRLAANLEGNQFSDRQLGDLVETVMDRPR